jgi:hypothetical protein
LLILKDKKPLGTGFSSPGPEVNSMIMHVALELIVFEYLYPPLTVNIQSREAVTQSGQTGRPTDQGLIVESAKSFFFREDRLFSEHPIRFWDSLRLLKGFMGDVLSTDKVTGS